jgi:hypothetical protein
MSGAEAQPSELLGGPWQICFVVADLEAALSTWWQRYGVGPWQIWELGPHNMNSMEIRGSPGDFAMKLALAKWGPLEIELIEPLDDASIYGQSLRAHEGRAHVHHLHCTAADYDASLAALQGIGVGALMSGGFQGARFSYLATEEELGTVLEIGHHPDGSAMPAPHAVYPEQGTA